MVSNNFYIVTKMRLDWIGSPYSNLVQWIAFCRQAIFLIQKRYLSQQGKLVITNTILKLESQRKALPLHGYKSIVSQPAHLVLIRCTGCFTLMTSQLWALCFLFQMLHRSIFEQEKLEADQIIVVVMNY